MKYKFWPTAVLALLTFTACGRKPLPELPPGNLRDTPGDSVESVIFLIGDVGKAEWGKYPVVHRLASDIDQWSRILNRDSSVATLFLGDNIYPVGLRDPTDPEWPQDSLHLEAQVDVMRAPGARTNKAFAVFIPGNHDWGHKFGAEGEARLRNMEEFIERRRARGINVSYAPPAGSPGPGIIDIGDRTRIIIIDTAWWLLSPNAIEKERLMDRVLQAMVTRGQREIVIVAHHPFRSASAHGGLHAFWQTIGIKWLLSKSGAALQDLNSLPYRDFLDRLTVVFERTGAPLLFAGGHDHVLQVLKGRNAREPRFIVVSGAGSKVSRVGHIDGMLFRGDEPGYMRLIIKKSGPPELFVVSAPKDFLVCDSGDEAHRRQCVSAGVQAFRNTFAIPLR